MTKTQRSYTDKETGIRYDMYQDQADRLRLIDKQGNECNGFYCCAFTDCTIKLNTGKQVKLSMGEFYSYKEGETATHRKFFIEPRFRKL